MRRSLRLLLLLAVAVLMPAIPARGDTADARAHAGSGDVVVFWHALPERHSARFEHMLGEYVHEKKAHFRIEVKRFPSMDALREALLADGPHPHLALIDASWQADLVGKGRLVCAEDLMNRTGSMARIIFKADTFPSMWSAVQHEGKAWTLPAFAVTRALLYSPQMLAQAGFKAPPRTWTDLVAYGRKLTQKGGAQWGFVLPTADSPRELGRLLQSFTQQAGAAAPTVTTLSYRAPEYGAALTFWVDLVDKHKVAPRENVDVTKAAMFVGTVEDLLAARAAGRELHAAPLPRGKAAAAPLMLYSIAVMHGHPDQLDRLWQLSYWMVEFEEMLPWALETPYIPANKQVTLSPGYFQYLQANPGIRAFLAQLPVSHIDPCLPAYGQMLEALGESARAALEKRQAPQDALSAADEKARSLLPPTAPAGSGG